MLNCGILRCWASHVNQNDLDAGAHFGGKAQWEGFFRLCGLLDQRLAVDLCWETMPTMEPTAKSKISCQARIRAEHRAADLGCIPCLD